MVSSELAIDAEDLTKRYGATTALGGLNLHVPAGSVLGLLGPNGAGKTTAVREAAPERCYSSSSWLTPRPSRSGSTPAGCGGGSTWRSA